MKTLQEDLFDVYESVLRLRHIIMLTVGENIYMMHGNE